MNEPVLSLPLSEVRRLLGAGSGDGAPAVPVSPQRRGPGRRRRSPPLARPPGGRSPGLSAAAGSVGRPPSTAHRPGSAAGIHGGPTSCGPQNGATASVCLVGEAQRRLGRVLSTEELKILLSLHDYLGLPTEVIGILITYCIQRSRARGLVRAPSLRTH